MAQDENRFEPRVGRSRRDTVRTPTTLRMALMGRVARTGGNPRRLPSALPGASAPPAPLSSPERFNARGRGAKIAARFPCGSGLVVRQKRSRSNLLLEIVEAYMNRRSASQTKDCVNAKLDRLAREVSRTSNECVVISHSLYRFIVSSAIN